MTRQVVIYVLEVRFDDEIVPAEEIVNQPRFNHWLRTRGPLMLPGVEMSAMLPFMKN